jgi:hypothetical protein
VLKDRGDLQGAETVLKDAQRRAREMGDGALLEAVERVLRDMAS